jgi:hypothetical protein
MRYMDDIKRLKPFKSIYALCKATNMKPSFYANLKRFVEGKNTYPKYITLDIFIRLYSLHKIPFDLGVYIHEYEQQFPS